MNKALSKNIEIYCRANSITTAEFERMCGLSNAAVASWNKGHSPTYKCLVRLEKGTGIPVEKWLSEDAL